MRTTLAALVLCASCGHRADPHQVLIPPPTASASSIPTVPKSGRVAGDFGAVLDACPNATFGAGIVGDHVVIGASRKASARFHVGVLDLKTMAHRELVADQDAEASGVDTVTLTGASWDALEVSLESSCAPNLEAPRQPVECTETTFRVTGPDVKVTIGTSKSGDEMLPASVPPSGWERDVKAWLRTMPRCTLSAWTPMTKDFALARALSDCKFGMGAVVQRTKTGLHVAVAAQARNDANLVVRKAANVWWVGSGVDGRTEELWRVGDAALEQVALPAVASDVFAVGERLWIATLQGVYVRTASGWDLDPSCGATQTTLAPLDTTRVLVTCSDGRRVVLDTLGHTPPLRFPPVAGDHSFRGLVFEGHSDVLLADDQGDAAGHLFAARYHGRSFTCAPEGPIHFD